jgi:hypothetical protein
MSAEFFHLAQFDSATEALRYLYDVRKKDQAISLSQICKDAGIPSRGYLSSVLRGHRQLHTKYRRAICKAFSLTGNSAGVVRTLVDLGSLRNSSLKKKPLLMRRLERYRKVSRISHQSMPMTLDIPLFAEVFCAFGLYQDRPTEEDLVSYFGKRNEREVLNAVDALLQQGLIRPDGLHYRIENNLVFYKDSENGLTHLNYLIASLKTTTKEIPTWFEQTDIAHFQSSILSVKKQDLIELLPMIKAYLDLKRSQLESSEADMLIRFSCQIHPVGRSI